MPVYGVEKYLNESVQSVLAQTYTDFELILVDDCSPDRCPALCDEWAKKDERIKVIHLNKNGGLSNARNQGFLHAQGEYTFFMDSDDTISPDLLFMTAKHLDEAPIDVLVFGVHEEYFTPEGEKKDTNDLIFGESVYLPTPEDLRPYVIRLEEKTLYGYAWNKIYRTSLLRKYGLVFRNIRLIEDITFNIEVFSHISSLYILNSAPYHYKKRLNQSLTNAFLPDYFELNRKRVELLYRQLCDWDICDDEAKRTLADILGRYTVSGLQRNCDPRAHMTSRDRKNWLKALYQDPLWISLQDYLSTGRSKQGILNIFLKKKHTGMCLLIGRLLHIIRLRLPFLFFRIKQQSN